MKLSLRQFLCSVVLIGILLICYYIVKLRELIVSDNVPPSSRNGVFVH